jgi:drug/metabolite transporter (DMT)-like permease
MRSLRLPTPLPGGPAPVPAVKHPERLRGLLWATASALGSAAFMIPWKLATRHGEPKETVFVLLTSAALLNTAVLPLSRRNSAGRSSPAAWGIAGALAVLTLLGNEASAAGIARISGPLLSVLQRFEVVVVGLLAWLVLDERPNLGFWVGTALASLGVVLVQGGGAGTAHASGIVYALLAASAFAGMAVLTRRFIAQIEPLGLNALRLWLSLPCWIVFHGELPGLSRFSLELVFYGAIAALFGPFLGRLFFMYALRHVEARIAALCVLLAPVATLALSWAILGDAPTAIELLGGLVILMGVAIPIIAAERRRSAERARISAA